MKMLRIAVSAALLVAASISFSQTKEGDLVANVPFGFIVAQHKLPAGRYNVTRLNEFTLRISNGPDHSVLVNTQKSQRPENDVSSKMVFHRYGDTYFLSEIWVGSNSIGRALAPSREEREIAQSTAEREIAVVRMGR
jgi:hypothetical protein